MPEDRIKRKELWQGLEKIKQKDWARAGRRLGLEVSARGGKGSHLAIRRSRDTTSLITTVQKDLSKQLNQTIFKQLLDSGISEDDIWKALKMLK